MASAGWPESTSATPRLYSAKAQGSVGVAAPPHAATACWRIGTAPAGSEPCMAYPWAFSREALPRSGCPEGTGAGVDCAGCWGWVLAGDVSCFLAFEERGVVAWSPPES